MQALSNLAGQLVTTGIPAARLDAATRQALERLGPSGIVLFARNIENVDQLRALTAELHALPSHPLVAIDHEGGRVTRLGPPFTAFPAPAVVGRAGPETAYAVGRAMGRELASVGIDVDYAPLLDVASNPANPVIGERAFGSDPTAATAAAIAFMRGLESAGVIPCGKHFPGHGDTDRDSHLERPIVHRHREALEAVELVPFRAAIHAGIPLLMTAHVVYPALDADRVATLSAAIVRRLLRDELGFGGVVVTDDLGMRAISDQVDAAAAGVAALQAGIDWLLFCHDLDAALQSAEHLARAIGHGTLSAAEAAASAARIAHLKSRPRPSLPLALPVAAHGALAERLRAMVPGASA